MTMETDFEQRLREGLHSRAAQVTPNPETWERVRAGIRRERRFRILSLGTAGAALAALAAVAVLVLPGALSGPDIELEPPGVAGQPEDGQVPPAPEPPTPAPPAAVPGEASPALLLATAEEAATVGPGGYASLVAPDGGMDAVAMRPGATLDQLDAVYTADCELGRLVGTPGGTTAEPLPSPQGCAGGPRFSPDGTDLAWIEADDAGGFTLQTVGWDDGPVPARNAGFGLDADALAGFEGLRVAGWTWTGAEGGTTSGFLALAGVWSDGATHVLTLPIERQGDGALALPGGSAPLPFDSPGQRVLAFQHAGCPSDADATCPAGVAWTLELAEDGVLRLIRSDEGEQLRVVELDDGVLDGADLTTGPVWLDVVGEAAVLGDGTGRAWTVAQGRGGTWDVEELVPDRDIVHAAALRARAAAPDASGEPDLGAEVDESAGAPGWVADLPAEVAATRTALLAAVDSGELEALRPLIPADGFTFSYGAEGDPIAYWEDRQAEGLDVLGLIERLLQLPPVAVGDDAGLWAWPFAYDRPYESLSSAELVALEQAIGPEALEAYAEHGTYLHHRLGIAADGTWRYFVAGD